MPCHSEPDYSSQQQLAEQLEQATRAACEALGLLEKEHPSHYSRLSADTKAWWNDHKYADARRREFEAETLRQEREITLRNAIKSQVDNCNVSDLERFAKVLNH